MRFRSIYKKIDQSIKKMEEQKSRITDPLVYLQMFSKSMKGAYASKYDSIFILNVNVVFVKALTLSISF